MTQNSIKIGSWRLSWPILSLSWAVLGLSWPVMGLSWLVLGLSWACLGLPWVCLGSVLGLSWRAFGLPWPVLGLSWAVLACLGLSWACFGLRRACLQTFFTMELSGIAATRVWCSVLSACSCPFRCSEHLYLAVLEPTRFSSMFISHATALFSRRSSLGQSQADSTRHPRTESSRKPRPQHTAQHGRRQRHSTSRDVNTAKGY